jgi:hypothetical protein
MYIIEPRHERQVTHDTCIPATFLGTHFPSAASVVRLGLITPFYVSNKAGVSWALETPGRAPLQPDAVYHIGGKKFWRGRAMCCTKCVGPFIVVIGCFMEQPQCMRPFRCRLPSGRRMSFLCWSSAGMGEGRWHDDGDVWIGLTRKEHSRSPVLIVPHHNSKWSGDVLSTGHGTLVVTLTGTG